MERVIIAAVERLHTIDEASTQLNVPAWLLRRAIKRGQVPVHRIGNGRARVLLSEVMAAVHASRQGGGND